MRTYERGVEDETLACGTGAVASSVISALQRGVTSPVSVLTRGGEKLLVCFERTEDRISNVVLEGSTDFVFRGEITLDVSKTT